MHTDEAVNGYIVGQLLAGEAYTYDPRDRHGPALAELALPLARMQGAQSFSELTEGKLRVTSVVAGTITILLFGAATELFGFLPCLLAALLFALAPLPVYYDRDFIHEPLFCAAVLALMLSSLRAATKRSVIQAALAGTCAAILLATKETAVLHIFAMAAAGIFVYLLNRCKKPVSGSRAVSLLGAAVTAFVVVIVILFTWFGKNADALPALLHAIPEVLIRAEGQGHEKPFWYYGRLLTGGWSGGMVVALAGMGLVIGLTQRTASAYQWLALYGLLLGSIYSLIPYKTPWLALNLWLPLALLAAKAIVEAWRLAEKQLGQRKAVPIFFSLAVAAVVLIGHDTRKRVFWEPAEESNPYAYAQTSDDIVGLPAEIEDLARRDGISAPRIAVIASDPWPLPWYLRHFHQVGFWQPGQQVEEADYVITSGQASEQYADRLRKFRPEFFGIRPGVLILLWSPGPK
jgi:uncharacterized protein (TIGR03663 family)